MNSNASFLPDDYLDQKAERRTNLISLILFGVVMLGVFMAFLVTNQRWSVVKRDQMTINTRYAEAAEQIKELMMLEEQKGDMLEKAELAAALVERVPRSVLFAELINRMPQRLSLFEFELTSEKIKAPITEKAQKRGGRLKPKRAQTKQEAGVDRQKIRPPKFRVSISLTGVAPTGQEVSQYLARLNRYTLLEEVRLDYTEEKEIDNQLMQQFKIDMVLDPSADVRDVNPLIMPRRRNDPMGDRQTIVAPAPRAGVNGR